MKSPFVILSSVALLIVAFSSGCKDESPPTTPDRGSKDQAAQDKADSTPAANQVTSIAAKVADTVPTIAWASSWDDAKKLATEQKKLVMIDFYMIPCGWCRKMDQDTFSNAEVIKQIGDFVPVKINGTKEGRTLAQQYGVQGYPTIVFVYANGKQFATIPGYVAPTAFLTELKSIQKNFNKS